MMSEKYSPMFEPTIWGKHAIDALYKNKPVDLPKTCTNNESQKELVKRLITQIGCDATQSTFRMTLKDAVFMCNAFYTELSQGEPVAKVVKNLSGQILFTGNDGNYFDISKYIGKEFYLAPPSTEALQKDKSELIEYAYKLLLQHKLIAATENKRFFDSCINDAKDALAISQPKCME